MAAMAELPSRSRVVVVGGGVIGLSVARHLALLSESDVLVLERENLLGSGSSAASAGGIRQQFAEEWNVLYAMEGARQIRRLEEETGFDPVFREHGYLLLARTPARLRELEKNAALQNRLGLPTEILGPEEIGRRFPVLETEGIEGAAFLSTDGYMEPHALLTAFERAAREGGVAIRTGIPVVDLLREGDSVVGVRTPEGDVRSEFVVNAAGPRGGEVAAMADLDLPLTPCRRQIFATHPIDVPGDLPLVLDLDDPFYFRPEAGGVILSAAEVEETRNHDLAVDTGGLEELVARAVRLCPRLADATIARGWAGLRTLTPDGSAILGDAPGRPGLLLAVGMSGHGITHGPAVGRALAERIVFGEARSLPLVPFSAARFEGERDPAGGVLS
jgi:sarcosine oxidase subunit beta